MKIARPSKPEVPFKRKRSPPPQATKLLRYSLLAGVVFMVMLAIVFLPRMFPSQPPLATPVQMEFMTDIPSNETRLTVLSVGALVELSKLNATFSRYNAALATNETLATLGPPLGGGNSTFSFHDANNSGVLGPGDYFLVTASPTGRYGVRIYQLEGSAIFLVGIESWTGKPST
ncbi:MAG TPA: hypothetical protein VF992_02235 [Thermoplasmata archaeon]